MKTTTNPKPKTMQIPACPACSHIRGTQYEGKALVYVCGACEGDLQQQHLSRRVLRHRPAVHDCGRRTARPAPVLRFHLPGVQRRDAAARVGVRCPDQADCAGGVKTV